MNKWRNQKDSFQQALRYIKGRKDGSITCFKTPWERMNDATTGGLEWGSTTVIAGRPGTGKTLIKDQIIREGIKLNCTVAEYESGKFPFRVLEFQLEMIGRVSALREFTSIVNKSYKELCSVNEDISEEVIKRCYEYSKKRVGYPIDLIDEACTVTEFTKIIESYLNTHAKIDSNGVRTYVNTIVTLDHTLLLKKGKTEKDKMEILYNLGEAVTSLKKRFPIAFILLSQLNRNVDSAERNEDGKYGNYILDSDIFGADAVLQHADTVIGLNRPGKKKIRFYGPDRFIIDNENILAAHFLKCRNGDTRISFFEAQYAQMKIKEIPPPPTNARNGNRNS